MNRDLGTALEVHAPRNAMPEQHAEHAGDREDQREAEEVPLLTQPVDVCVPKQFHVASSSDTDATKVNKICRKP